ncbi:CTP synthase 1 [Thrips palmi]|uniref:CTP synthase n=1 Tax=Thrips palmi TaxID=161013 RepID=A0A6P8Z4U0_THRPL|nr:CTP synthase 1 [Thrips palmi]
MKYILVTGGVISGVGKGVISSSFGTILKSCGVRVTCIKIDPYINIDAGTFSPYEHGETYVLDDGGEVDLDLGNYERFLDITLHRDNNITTGKIYQQVISKERKGDYLGKTVQVVPHITDAIQEWVERVAHIPIDDTNEPPEVCIVELGGTIGDIEGMPFVEAFRQFQFRVKRENFCCAHVSLVPQPRSTGEPKTKPTQSSVRELRGLGLSPDLIVCRSEKPIGQSVRDKVSNFCHVGPEQVICIHDLSSVYRVPILMEGQGVVEFLKERLHLNFTLPQPKSYMMKWRNLADRVDLLRKEVNIALVGKYTKLEDSYASVLKALQHAAIDVGYKLNVSLIEACNLEKATKIDDPVMYHKAWQTLCKSDGVIVPGGFGKRGFEGKLEACQWCREMQKPFLGICLGLQAAVVEFSRNVLKLDRANSTEVDPETPHPLIIDMPEHNQGVMGGTMRLGKRTTVFTSDKSVMKQLYGNKPSVDERHRHRFEVNPKYVKQLEAAGLKFTGHDTNNTRMEILEMDNHPYYVATQYHPEYLSRPLKPSAPFMGLILASVGILKPYLEHCNSSKSSDVSEESEFLFLSADDLEAVSAVEKFNKLKLETGESP